LPFCRNLEERLIEARTGLKAGGGRQKDAERAHVSESML